MSYLRTASLISACAFAALLAGCSSNTVSSRDAEVRGNLTPEMHTLGMRQIDEDNQYQITVDENGRMLNQDLARALLFDRPSRLTPERIPH